LSVGGRGRWIILHIPALRKLAVFDVLARQIVHHVPLAEERVAFAAGVSKLVVVSPDAGVIQRWDLKTGRREATTRLALGGRVTLVAMGSGADGPVLIHCRQPGARGTPRWSLVDADTFKASPLELALTNFGDAQHHALASTDGKAFVMPHSGHPGSNRLECLILEAKPQIARISGYAPALLGPDHRHLFTAQGIFKLDGTPVEKAPKAALLLPATSGDYYLAAAVSSSPTKGQPAISDVSVYRLGDDRPLAPIPSIDFAALLRAQDPVLTVSKRVLFVPEAKQIITIPAGNNRLVIHRLDVEELAVKAE
jgi:hypothetical protein